MAVGKKFSVDFQQAVEINGNTQIMVQPEGQPVEKASVEQLGVALMEEEIIPNPDGSYPKMTVGFAENIVGDGSATAEEFSFRPTAGVNRNTLNDGAARIHTLKGNSVVRNQLISHSRFESTEYYNIQGGATLNVNGGIATITLGTSNYSGITHTELHGKLLVGHKYLSITEAKADAQMQNVLIPYVSSSTSSPKNTVSTEWRSYSFVYAATSAIMSYGPARAGIYGTDFQSGDKIYIKSFRTIDLTQEFGAGKEPLTIEEYYQRKPIGINEDEYNEGKLVNLVPQAIKTTRFNQWDEQWEVGTINGGTGTNSASNADIRSSNYIPVLPATPYYFKCTSNMTAVAYNANKEYICYMLWGQKANLVETTPSNASYIRIATSGGTYGAAYKNDICISLYWPTEYGNLYGTYKPYKPFERDLSWVAKYFPNGMRSTGNVADEIRFNSTTQQWEAVQRVDVRPYAAGDESDSAVITDGTNTNYTLPTPTITPIAENVNFDYDVSDYGTEELIVAEGVESAPLSASIEYSPNVLAMLKNAPGIANDVDMLKSQLAALTAQLTALTTTNNE